MQSKNEPLLTLAQIVQLAEILVEECGRNLANADVTDQIGQLLEDVAGFEVAADSIVNEYIKTIRSKYYELCSD